MGRRIGKQIDLCDGYSIEVAAKHDSDCDTCSHTKPHRPHEFMLTFDSLSHRFWVCTECLKSLLAEVERMNKEYSEGF